MGYYIRFMDISWEYNGNIMMALVPIKFLVALEIYEN